MKKLYLFILLLFALPAHAAITYRNSVACRQPTGTIMQCVAATPLTVVNGDAIVIFIYSPANSGGTGVSDTCNNTWVPQPNTRLNIWTVIGATGGSCTITATHGGGGDSRFSFVVASYSGVQSVAQPLNGPQSTAPQGTAAMTIALQDAGNVMVAAIGQNQGGGAISASPGAVRVANDNQTAALADMTLASPGDATITFTYTPSVSFIYTGAVELRVAGSTGKVATQFDMQHTILLASATGANYTLPATGLSSTWCSYVMPTGAAQNPFLLARQPGPSLNGGHSDISIYPWQMTRVCEDSTGNYWANPPLVAGSGILITPSPSAITISSTGGGGGGGPATQLQFGSTPISLGTTPPTSNQVLTYNGSAIIGATPSAPSSVHFGSTTIPLSSTAPTAGQSLIYDGTEIVGTNRVALIASGTQGMSSNNNLAAAACTPAASTSAPGVTTTDVVAWSFASTPVPQSWIRMTVEVWVTAGQVNFIGCNNTANAITSGGSINVNWHVLR